MAPAVALELLAAEPARVRRLLLHTPLLGPTMLRRPFRFQVAAVTAVGPLPIAAVSAVGRWRVLADLYRRLVVEGSADVDLRSAEVNFRNQLRANPRAAREWLGEATTLEFTALLDGWTGPAEILAAADDRIVDIEALRRYCRLRPRLRLHLLAAAGHGWTREFMAAQQELLQRWVTATPTGA